MMSLVRLLGFTTFSCGCVTGKYRELATHREVVYVEEKGGCAQNAHRRNHTLAPARFGAVHVRSKSHTRADRRTSRLQFLADVFPRTPFRQPFLPPVGNC